MSIFHARADVLEPRRLTNGGRVGEGCAIATRDSFRTPFRRSPRILAYINLTEALLCTRAVGPHMLGRRSGKIINVAAERVTTWLADALKDPKYVARLCDGLMTRVLATAFALAI
jgi:hypothetical protein